MADRFRSGRKKGVVLLATLVFIFMLTVIVTLFLQEVESRIRYRAQTAGDRDLRRIAYDYLEHSTAVLSEFITFDSGLMSPTQGWGNPLAYAPSPIEYPGLEVSVVIEDATNELPLSLIDEDVFMSVMESLGINSFDAARFRDGYFDWIDANDDPRIQGSETREYEIDRRYQMLPPNAPIKNKQELKYIAGFYDWLDPSSRSYNPELFEIFKGCITTLHKYPVNLNSAKPEVLEILRIHNNINMDTLRLYQAGNDRILGTMDDNMLSESMPSMVLSALGENQNKLFGFEMKMCRIRIDIRRYETVGFHLEVLLDLGGQQSSTQSQPVENPNPNESVEGAEKTNEDKQKTANSGNKGFEVLVIRENFVESE
jgi:type II secretory pathway component PulK